MILDQLSEDLTYLELPLETCSEVDPLISIEQKLWKILLRFTKALEEAFDDSNYILHVCTETS